MVKTQFPADKMECRLLRHKGVNSLRIYARNTEMIFENSGES